MAPSLGLFMARSGSMVLEAASAVGRKACQKVLKIDPGGPPLTTSQPVSQRRVASRVHAPGIFEEGDCTKT